MTASCQYHFYYLSYVIQKEDPSQALVCDGSSLVTLSWLFLIVSYNVIMRNSHLPGFICRKIL